PESTTSHCLDCGGLLRGKLQHELGVSTSSISIVVRLRQSLGNGEHREQSDQDEGEGELHVGCLAGFLLVT
uniref:Uncharacterized protein n=1 Tax=Anopheles quadriannulatus TaxID=34691 RepID=A0A182XTR0_ANOQN